jgi:hypothetical protein
MLQLSIIEAQLTKLGVKRTFFCRPEIRELQHILMDNEQIIQFVVGRYHGGIAVLAATEQRLLLIDKKPLYLTVEDIRYDMISEIDVSARLLDASIKIFTINKELVFTSVRQQHLRALAIYVQQRVMALRQYQHATPPMAPASAQQLVPAQPPALHNYEMTAAVPLSVPARVITQIARSPHAVGSAAILGAYLHNPNPFNKAPLTVHRHWSAFGGN